MELTTKHIKNHSSKIGFAILYIHMHNIVGTNLYILNYSPTRISGGGGVSGGSIAQNTKGY